MTGEGGHWQIAQVGRGDRRKRLENDAAILKSWQLCLSFKLDVLIT